MAKKIKKEENLEVLLQQLRDSQGQGDALVEITGNNVRVTTAHGSEENQDIDLSESEEIISIFWEATKNQQQSLLDLNKSHIELVKTQIELEKKGILQAVYKKFEKEFKLMREEYRQSLSEIFRLKDELFDATEERKKSAKS